MTEQKFSGEELGRMLRQAAHDAGQSIDTFAARLAQQPNKWLCQMEAIERPRAQTAARVLALIEGRSDLPPPANSRLFGMKRNGAPAPLRSCQCEPDPDPVTRDPCARCGVRADLHAANGCNRWRAG